MIKIYFLLIVSIFLISCEANDCANVEKPYEINIYGSSECGYCLNMKEEMKYRCLSYNFYDVLKDSEKQDEMWEKVNAQLPGTTTIYFPVMEINGEIIMRPDWPQVLEILEKSRDATEVDLKLAF
jgi:glutaredoxin